VTVLNINVESFDEFSFVPENDSLELEL